MHFHEDGLPTLSKPRTFVNCIFVISFCLMIKKHLSFTLFYTRSPPRSLPARSSPLRIESVLEVRSGCGWRVLLVLVLVLGRPLRKEASATPRASAVARLPSEAERRIPPLASSSASSADCTRLCRVPLAPPEPAAAAAAASSASELRRKTGTRV